MYRSYGFVVALASLLAASAVAADPGVKTELVGGTLTEIVAKSTARLDYSGADEMVFHFATGEIRVAYHKVNTLEYGQTVSRRYAAAVLVSPLLLLSKARKHYVTVGYEDATGHQQVVVSRVEKGDIRSVLVGLEARTGRRFEYQDEEARKAIKG
jgi:hypothetical protein